MPTGYTDAVGTGEMTDFHDYAMLCARAFGATIMMRDDPLDAPIREFEPSTYYTEWLDEARKELAELEPLEGDDLEKLVDSKHREAVAYWEQTVHEKTKTKERYEAMLEKARAYQPPTPDHEEFAKFLVTQLEESIKFDCGLEYYQKPERSNPDEWKRGRMSELRERIKQYAEKQQEENERTAGRNKWVADLRQSLAAATA